MAAMQLIRTSQGVISQLKQCIYVQGCESFEQLHVSGVTAFSQGNSLTVLIYSSNSVHTTLMLYLVAVSDTKL